MVSVFLTVPLLSGTVAPAQPPIRSGIVLVPVDVRVIDERGDPVVDLSRSDFSVYENDVLQETAHFEVLAFGPGQTPASETPTRGRIDATVPHRTFIFLLGRGRLNHPGKGLDALIDFVQYSLLPADRVGLVAYLRSLEPTTNHQAVVRFLRRYRERHEDIEGRIEADFRATIPFGSGPALSKGTRQAIDDLFALAEGLLFKNLPGAGGSDAIRYSNWNYIEWAIADAGRIPGEKHLVVVAEEGLGLRRLADERADHVLVRWAAGARTAISFIHTGGLAGFSVVRGRVLLESSGDAFEKDSIHAPSEHRLLAELTGGVSSYYSYASKPLEALNRASRFQYLLGYYPKANIAPDAPRRIRVVVRRAGVQALHRHAFQLQPRATDAEDFRRAAADDRMAGALAQLAAPPRTLFNGQQVGRAKSLRLSTRVKGRAPGSSTVVTLALDPARLAFAPTNEGTFRASVYVRVFADDAQGARVGSVDRQFDLTLSLADMRLRQKHWLQFDVEVALVGPLHQVSAAVYDFQSDRVVAGREIVAGGR